MKRRLWWIAQDEAELYEWKRDFFSKSGVTIINLANMPETGELIQVIFELEEFHALELLGYVPEEVEWLEPY